MPQYLTTKPPETLWDAITLREAKIFHQSNLLFEDFFRTTTEINALRSHAPELRALWADAMARGDTAKIQRIQKAARKLIERDAKANARRRRLQWLLDASKRIRDEHTREVNNVIERIPIRETLREGGYRGGKRRAVNALLRWVQDVMDWASGLAMWAAQHLPGGTEGRAYQSIVNIVAQVGRIFFRVSNWVFNVLDFTFIANQLTDAINSIRRWWNREASEEIQQAVGEEFYKNLPAPTPIFEPKGSDDYAKALAEYARVSNRDYREILVNSGIAIAVEAGKKGITARSTRATTNLLKSQTRRFYTTRISGHLRIQWFLDRYSRQSGRNVRIADEGQARAYVSRAKVKPLTRSRVAYYRAGWFQIASQISAKGQAKRPFQYKGKIPRGLGTAEVSPKGTKNHRIIMRHHGAWARQSAQLAIEHALKREAKGKMQRVAKKQEQRWTKMKVR